MEERIADFTLFFASIETVFVVEHNRGAFRYILEKFEEFLLISGRENALRVIRLVNILCKSLLAKIQPSQLKQVSWRFNMRSAKYYFKMRCFDSCLLSIS